MSQNELDRLIEEQLAKRNQMLEEWFKALEDWAKAAKKLVNKWEQS